MGPTVTRKNVAITTSLLTAFFLEKELATAGIDAKVVSKHAVQVLPKDEALALTIVNKLREEQPSNGKE